MTDHGGYKCLEEHVMEGGLVSVYECSDGSWRVSHYPYDDKDRNLTKEEAFALAPQRMREALILYKGLTT